jgi:hypothetical protein
MSFHISTASAINSLGGCCGKITSKCKLLCPKGDAGNWRPAPNDPRFQKSLSQRICRWCRAEWSQLKNEEATTSEAEAEVARMADAAKHAPLVSARNATGESFDD